MASVTIEIGSRGTVVMIEPELRKGLTRRAFRQMPEGGYDWCAYSDWKADGERARFFGWSSKDLPASMMVQS